MVYPQNHPVRSFAPGSPERISLQAELERQRNAPHIVRPVIGGRSLETGRSVEMIEPHAHGRSLGAYQSAGAREAGQAIVAAMHARGEWSRMDLSSRQAIFLRAAELLSGPFNDQLMAATMLQQSKTTYQAEIDASCELIDFLRFNVAYASELEAFQPMSVDTEALVTALVRGAFDYQGQKCSAGSRAYIPKNLYADVCERLTAVIAELSYGDVTDFSNFMGAVIDERAYDTIKGFLDYASSTSGHRKIAGDSPTKSEGYFVPPTVFECRGPHSKLMADEIFGPVLALYAYDESDLDDVLDLVMTTTPYALTGAIFARDQAMIDQLTVRLRDTAGNFYINDKPTGAIVGRQPFGGARKSGTNDKAGSPYNLLRWVSHRAVKENLLPPKDPLYPHMA